MKIVVYSHLLNGGAKRVWSLIVDELKKDHLVVDYSENSELKFSNIIKYFYYIYVDLPKRQVSLAKEIKNNNPDIVLVSHSYLTKSPYLLRHVKNVVYICHEEPREFYDDNKYLIKGLKAFIVNIARLPLKYIDRENVLKANILLANSNYSKNKLSNIYGRLFKVLPMPLVLNSFKYNYNPIKQYLAIGSTSIFKGMDFLIRAIGRLPREYRYPLIIVGDKGRDHEYIMDLAYELEVQVSHFVRINDNDLVNKYASSYLLLAAAHNEPFGLSLIEALSFGLPVVSVDEGGYSEIVDKMVTNSGYGMLIKRNELKFSEAILRMIKINRMDKKEIIKYIKGKYSISKTINSLNKIFETI